MDLLEIMTTPPKKKHLKVRACELEVRTYNSRQKSWDTLHFFTLHLTFMPLLPPNNVVFC